MVIQLIQVFIFLLDVSSKLRVYNLLMSVHLVEHFSLRIFWIDSAQVVGAELFRLL